MSNIVPAPPDPRGSNTNVSLADRLLYDKAPKLAQVSIKDNAGKADSKFTKRTKNTSYNSKDVIAADIMQLMSNDLGVKKSGERLKEEFLNQVRNR